jgi:alkyldihydroxyacetonephosphate synthase
VIDGLIEATGLALDDVLAPGPGRYRGDLWPLGLKLGSRSAADGPPVLFPRDTAAVSRVLAWASSRGARVLVRGAGTNVVGAIAGDPDVILSLERLAGIRELDTVSQIVVVGAGTLGGSLEQALEDDGLTLGHYPQSLYVSTVGGWLATRATGTYSARHGGIEQLVRGLTIVLPDGEPVAIAPRVRAPGGLDLLALACGAEGTLGVVTEVALTVRRVLPERLLCLGFPTLAAGLEAQRELVQQEVGVGLLRLYNREETRAVVAAGVDWEPGFLLIANVVGREELLDGELAAVREIARGCGGTELPAHAGEGWFARRYHAAGLMEDTNAPAGRAFDTIDASVPWRSALACALELEQALGGVSEPFFLHFSHAYTSGVGLYAMLYLERESDAAVVDALRSAWELALGIVESHGGAIGHHHGIGSIRSTAYRASAEGRVHARIAAALDERGTFVSSLLAETPDLGAVTAR